MTAQSLSVVALRLIALFWVLSGVAELLAFAGLVLFEKDRMSFFQSHAFRHSLHFAFGPALYIVAPIISSHITRGISDDTVTGGAIAAGNLQRVALSILGFVLFFAGLSLICSQILFDIGRIWEVFFEKTYVIDIVSYFAMYLVGGLKVVFGGVLIIINRPKTVGGSNE